MKDNILVQLVKLSFPAHKIYIYICIHTMVLESTIWCIDSNIPLKIVLYVIIKTMKAHMLTLFNQQVDAVIADEAMPVEATDNYNSSGQ
ncbi:hypothetical protein VNO77_35717 [Canavalia gladiata]|uniref:Uncharacterized protein n=1 Tax=Canavalia gladiata TaxID=3824 RepID=A0AAN9KA97_CANGL